MDALLTDALEALLKDHCTPDVVRAVEQSGNADALWRELQHSGFADAMLDEEHNGAGLSLRQAYPLLELCGKYALPLPLAETMLVRAVLVASGISCPDGAIAIAVAQEDASGVLAHHVHYGRVASWVLVQAGGQVRLLPAGEARQEAGRLFPLDVTLHWPKAAWEQAEVVKLEGDLFILQACAVSAQLAGALLTVFSKTLQYANEREQFGRPIGKFQAIQHQLSVMAEHTFTARMAACIGCNADSWQPDAQRVAVAKACTSEAALELAGLSHAIHGALGFTEEYDLQLYTRRLYHWRQTAGAESYWHDRIGAGLLESPDSLTLDAVREITAYNPPPLSTADALSR